MLNNGIHSRPANYPPGPQRGHDAASGRYGADALPRERHSGESSAPDMRQSAPMNQAEARALQAPVPSEETTRLLIPVDATERSRWALQYALAQNRGRQVEVDLLFVAEPVTAWQVLRFRTQREIAEFQSTIAQWLLEDAAGPLQAAGIPVRCHFREGYVPGQILETAEQLGCEQIVLPSPTPRLLSLLSRDTVRAVQRAANGVPVITVNRAGSPVLSK